MSKPSADFTAALIAGGKSTRMGRDKAALVIDGMPLWQRQIATLRALHPAQLLISGPLDGPWLGSGVEVVPDEFTDLGPLGALATVLSRMRCDRVLVLAVDLPAMTPEFLRTVVAQASSSCGVVPIIADRFEPLAAFYPRALHTIATHSLASDNRSLQSFVRAGIAARLLSTLSVPEEHRAAFHNLNTPADLGG